MFTPGARAKASVNWRQILQPPPTEAFKRGLTIRIELVENYFPCVLIHSVKIHQHWAFFLNFFCVAILRGMWDLCSPTRDWTCAPCSGSANFNYCQGSPNTELLMKTLKQTWVIPRTCLYIQNLYLQTKRSPCWLIQLLRDDLLQSDLYQVFMIWFRKRNKNSTVWIWGILRIPSPSRNPGKPIEFVTDWAEGSVYGMAGLRDHPKGYN